MHGITTDVSSRATRRILMAIFGGGAAGVLQLSGIGGLGFYLLVMALASLGVVTKAEFQPSLYFLPPTRTTAFTFGVLDRTVVLPYLLAWTLVYALSSPS
jgi:EMC6